MGYTNIVNIDYSRTVIEKMSALHRDKASMQWLEMDMTKLTFEDSSFDLVLDKAAMDAILVDEEDLYDPKMECKLQGHLYCSEMSRVLKNGGKLIQVHLYGYSACVYVCVCVFYSG